MGIFKAYDIRGIYNDGLDVEIAGKIGYFLPQVMGGKRIAVGHDMRDSSNPLREALIEGMMAAGAHVFEVGLISTPMINFAVGRHGLDGGVQITASHNSKEYNGFKVAGKNALPIGYEMGLNRVEELVKNGEMPRIEGGTREKLDIMEDYLVHVRSFLKTEEKFHVAIDAANGMGGYTVPKILKGTNISFEGLYMELDGNFPNHEANPLKEENLKDLKEMVRSGEFNFGMAFDGDADRIMFIDEKGDNIPADIITAIIGKWMVEHGHDGVLYDVRSSRMVKEAVDAAGGNSYLCMVGHAYFKQLLREKDAFFGGELAGHFYFKENYYTDSGTIMMMKMLNFLSEKKKNLSELAAPFLKYYQSGEINSEVEDKDGKIEDVAKMYKDGEQFRIDGLTVIYEKWWFNLRKSNTEPLLRLTLEADTEELMKEKVEDLLKIIRS
ncbi:phosphomannomutase/phosphoglucomutase [bacterium]|nr:phosphomannomutase/phosphoglucomutase [bacterium]